MGSAVAASQATGRALRPYPGKAYALVLDYAGVTIEHGHPSFDAVSTLEARDRDAAPQCDNCGYTAYDVRLVKCPTCGAVLRKGGQGRDIQVLCPICSQALLTSGRCARCASIAAFIRVTDSPSLVIGGAELTRVEGVFVGFGYGAPIRLSVAERWAEVGGFHKAGGTPKELVAWVIKTLRKYRP